MLPQIGMTEMLVLGILALAVLGPRDLSLMMRRMGRWTGKLRAMAWEFRQSFDEIGRQAELEELKKEVQALKENTGLEDVKRDLEKTSADISRETREATRIKPEESAAPSPEEPKDSKSKTTDSAAKDAAE